MKLIITIEPAQAPKDPMLVLRVVVNFIRWALDIILGPKWKMETEVKE